MQEVVEGVLFQRGVRRQNNNLLFSFSHLTSAFACLFMEGLADGAVTCGLPRDKANTFAAQMLLGAARLALESGKPFGQMKDEICSPGGTTIAGVRALEEGGLRAAAMNAVIAAYEKTLQLKK